MNSNILTHEELFQLVATYFGSEVSKIGKNNLETIVEDFIDGGKENINFETPLGGHNYDYVATMSLIVGVLQLIIASADYISTKMRSGEKPKPDTVINFILINYPDEPVNKMVENEEILNEISKIVELRDNEDTKA